MRQVERHPSAIQRSELVGQKTRTPCALRDPRLRPFVKAAGIQLVALHPSLPFLPKLLMMEHAEWKTNEYEQS